MFGFAAYAILYAFLHWKTTFSNECSFYLSKNQKYMIKYPPTLSACERGLFEFIALFLPMYVLFMILLIPFSFGSTPLLVKFSVGVCVSKLHCCRCRCRREASYLPFPSCHPGGVREGVREGVLGLSWLSWAVPGGAGETQVTSKHFEKISSWMELPICWPKNIDGFVHRFLIPLWVDLGIIVDDLLTLFSFALAKF